METINTIKSVATKAIWGDEAAHQEPISGVNGDVSKGEPYDAGNMEPQDTSPKNENAAVDETGIQPIESAVSNQGTTTSPNPITTKDSSAHKGDSTKAQIDVRDPSNPDTHHGKADAKNNVDDSGSGGLDLSKNPDKIDGPGPRPLEQVAKEHGGNAGAIKSGEESGSGSKSSGLAGGLDKVDTEEDRRDSGTGELYVKSSGLAADGGDFDASAPGAGREADRLLEEKGVHHDGPNGGIVTSPKANGDATMANGNGSPTKEKISLKTKIKNKLHRNSATSA